MADKIDAGVYSIKGGGYRAAITQPNGGVKDLGLFKTYDEAKKAYQTAQHALYPVAPTAFPAGTKTVELTATPLVTKKPTMKFRR
jgi:hypothetical protein